MATQLTALTSGLGGLSASYATIQDLINLSLPTPGDPAYFDANSIAPPYLVNGRTLKVIVTIDGITQAEYTQTFTADYATLDLLVAAISIPGVQALNNGGVLRLRTIKTGISQNIVIDPSGTANTLIGYNAFFESVATGRSSLTSEISEDEMTYALVSASSIANGYLSRRYNLPLATWSFDLIQVVCDIAGYTLLKRLGFNPETYDANWVKRYNDAI